MNEIVDNNDYTSITKELKQNQIQQIYKNLVNSLWKVLKQKYT